MHTVALLDANVLYPAPLRDILLQIAVEDLFQPKWTEKIHEEWIEALLRNEPHRARKDLERTRMLMENSVVDALVDGYEALMEGLTLPDPNDRHVLAAAITGRCDLIITQNLSDFPPHILTSYGVQAKHPDEFLLELLEDKEDRFCLAVHKVRMRLKNPPYTPENYLEILRRQGLFRTTTQLMNFLALI
jgi:predicted nucleic acid-binding protein